MQPVRPLLLAVLLLSACSGLAPAAQTPLVPTASLTALITPQDLPGPTATSSPTPQLVPTPTSLPPLDPSLQEWQSCAQSDQACILSGHFLFERPIAASANQFIDPTYRYGSTQRNLRDPHHGVELVNPQGTPVLAAAPGRVIFAGSDEQVALARFSSFYGNVVVIEHSFPAFSTPLYSLYAHLFSISVHPGDLVSSAEVIGTVGATGAAIGSHLHFEVRQVNNDYRSNRNPALWLLPLPGTGALAGRLVDAHGDRLAGIFNLQRVMQGKIDPTPVTSLETYNFKEVQPVASDTLWQENFAVGDLPAGEYRLSLIMDGMLQEQRLTIAAGKLTFVWFVAK